MEKKEKLDLYPVEQPSNDDAPGKKPIPARLRGGRMNHNKFIVDYWFSRVENGLTSASQALEEIKEHFSEVSE